MSKSNNLLFATNFELWQEYIDPVGVFSEQEFETTPLAKKLEFVELVGELNQPSL